MRPGSLVTLTVLAAHLSSWIRLMGPRLIVVVGSCAVLLAIPAPALAHGLGGRFDLPAPLALYLGAAVLVLVVAFTTVGALWTEPRLQEPLPAAGGRPLPQLWRAFAGLGAFLLLLAVAAGIFGIDNPTRNPASVIVFVGLWLVLPFMAALVVDLYPAMSPWRRLPGWIGMRNVERPEQLRRLGYVPAVGVFLLFTWFALIAPDNGPRAIAFAAIVFTVYMLAMSWRFGSDTATQSADGFAVYTRFLGGMSPFSFQDGIWRRRPWLRGLASLPERPGMAAFVVAMIGSVAYDGASSTLWWVESVRGPMVDGSRAIGLSFGGAAVVAGTIGWAAVILLVGASYAAASLAAARLGDGATSGRHVARRFAHTLVPVGFSFAFAHSFTLLAFEGQLLISTFSDPFGLGWDLFGTTDRTPDVSLIPQSPAWVWHVQLGVVVLGLIASVILARDRALADFPPHRVLAAQYAMLVLMALLTVLGLTVMAAG